MYEWDYSRWGNFSAIEMSCPCCGEFWVDTKAFDKIQHVRSMLGIPVYLNSTHRCRIHNAKVGGRPLSKHKKIAFDISLRNHNISYLLNAVKSAGFTGLGYYNTFLHSDTGRYRYWVTKGGRKRWNGLIVY